MLVVGDVKIRRILRRKRRLSVVKSIEVLLIYIYTFPCLKNGNDEHRSIRGK